MSYATINGRSIVEGRITLPRVGVWLCDLLVEGGEALKGQVTVKAPGLTLKGTVARGNSFEQKVRVRVVAGHGGIGKAIVARGYTGGTIRQTLQDIATDTGEKLSATINTALLSQHVPAWSRVATEGGHAVTRLCDYMGAGTVWRFLSDGTLWVGQETWPTSVQPEEPTLDDDARGGRMIYGSTNLALLPGTRYRARKVDAVMHTIGEVTRTEVLFA